MREVHSGESLPWEIRKHSHKQYNCMFVFFLIRKEQAKMKASTRKEIIKIKAEIIEKEMNKTIAKINKTKS